MASVILRNPTAYCASLDNWSNEDDAIAVKSLSKSEYSARSTARLNYQLSNGSNQVM